jgi:hypothetical protein
MRLWFAFFAELLYVCKLGVVHIVTAKYNCNSNQIKI